MQKSLTELANRKIVRAEKARRLRAAAGATPRTASKAQIRPWLIAGMSRTAWYEQQRCAPDDRVTAPAALDDLVSPELDDCVPPDGFVTADPAPNGDHPVKLYSDLWGGWIPVPPIPTRTSAEPSIDASPGRADRLIAAVAHLPGGSDPAYQNTLRRLVADAEAHGAGR